MLYFWHGGIFMIPEMSSFSHKKEKLRVAAYCQVSTKHTEQLESLEIQKSYFCWRREITTIFCREYLTNFCRRTPEPVE